MNIFLVEDEFLIRKAVHSICADIQDCRIVGETHSGIQAVTVIHRLKPELVILDLSLPDIDGFQVIDRCRSAQLDSRFLLLTGCCDNYTLFRVERTRVHGLIDKASCSSETLRDAIAAINGGRTYFSAAFQEARISRLGNPRSFDKILSPTELRILILISKGWNDMQIAVRLEITPRTAQTHRSNLLRKLGYKNTLTLAGFAIKQGFSRFNDDKSVT